MIIVVVVILGCIVGAIASNKGRSFFPWFIYGALLFIVAIIHVLCISSEEEHKTENGELKKCPMCAEMIKSEAVKCRFCGADVSNVMAEPKGEQQMMTESRFNRIVESKTVGFSDPDKIAEIAEEYRNELKQRNITIVPEQHETISQ